MAQTDRTGEVPAVVLLGGSKDDSLSRDFGDDILIGGTITSALTSIMAEWARVRGLSIRQSHLLNGGGLNGTNWLNSTTVINDASAKNTLSGSEVSD